MIGHEKASSDAPQTPDRVRIIEPQRRIFWFKACLLYPQAGVGWESPDAAESGAMHTHRHDSSLELSYFVRGQVTWRIDKKDYELRRGDLLITRPGVTHGGRDDVKHPCERFYLELILPKDGKKLSGMTLAETTALAEAINTTASPVVRGSRAIHRLFRRLIDLHVDNPEDKDPLARFDARTTMHRLLLEAINCIAQHDDPGLSTQHEIHVSEEIEAALNLIRGNLSQSSNMNEIAEEVGLSISAFHRRFLLEIGITPSEYRVRQRIERAKQWLIVKDMSITSIAHSLGFSTSQYFATVFRKYVGRTPREFRKITSNIADTAE